MLMKPNQYDAQSRREYTISDQDDIGFFGNIVQKIEAYLEIRKERKELLALDDRMLQDIGLNRSEAELIASKPFNWHAVKVQR